MRAAAEREAEAERVKEELARRRDFLRHAILELGDLIDEAHRIVARNIAPIEIVRLNPKRSSGTWEFQVTGYTRALKVAVAEVQDGEFFRNGGARRARSCSSAISRSPTTPRKPSGRSLARTSLVLYARIRPG